MMNQKAVSKILVIKLRNIGDVLLTTPVFSSLRQRYPDAKLCALVNAGSEAMLLGNQDIDKVFVYERDRLKSLSIAARIFAELRFMMLLRSEGFDLVLNLTEGDRGAFISLFSGAATRVGIDAAGKGVPLKNSFFTHLVPPAAAGEHMVERNLDYLAPLGIPVTEKRVSFAYENSDSELIEELLDAAGISKKGFFHAHLTSRWMFKTMPPKSAARLVDEIACLTGLPVVFTAAPVEKELAYLREVIGHSSARCLDLGGRLTLKQLGALSSQASFFVGVDSAPMHLAAALDIQVFALFGPSSVVHWGPWDNRLESNPYSLPKRLQSTGRHLVLQVDRQCASCHGDGCNGSKISACLDFSKEELSAAVSKFISMLESNS